MAKANGNQSLGDYIRSRRSSIGLSLADAADASDLDASYWNKLENGHYRTPSPRYLSTIADVLGVPVEDLYALAGYEIPSRLPSFAPYMRAKYDLPDEAIAALEQYYEFMRNFYGIPKDQPVFPPKAKQESGGRDQEAA